MDLVSANYLGDPVQAFIAHLILMVAPALITFVTARRLAGRLQLPNLPRRAQRGTSTLGVIVARGWRIVGLLFLIPLALCPASVLVGIYWAVLADVMSVPLGWLFALVAIAAGVLLGQFLGGTRRDYRLLGAAAMLLVVATAGIATAATITAGPTNRPTKPGAPAVSPAPAGTQPSAPADAEPTPSASAPRPAPFAPGEIVLAGRVHATTPICVIDRDTAQQLGVGVRTPIAVRTTANAVTAQTAGGRTATVHAADLGPCDAASVDGQLQAPTFLAPGQVIREIDGGEYPLDGVTWVARIAVLTAADGSQADLVWHQGPDGTTHTGLLANS